MSLFKFLYDFITEETEDGNGGKYPADFSYLASTQSKITNLIVNRNAKFIKSNVIRNCNATLTSFSFEQNPLLETIQPYAFSYGTLIEIIDLRSCSKLKTIGSNAFENCHSVSSIYLPKGIVTLGDLVFSRTNISSFTFPASVNVFPGSCFGYCQSLKEIIIPPDSNILSFGRYCIRSTLLTTISISSKVNSISASAFEGSKLESIIVDKSNENFFIQNDFLIENSTMKVVSFPPGLSIDTATIPDGVTSIGGTACGLCRFKHVIFPLTVTKIMSYSFYLSLLVDVNIHENITFIDINAFAGCFYLSKIILPEGLNRLRSNCFASTSISSIDLPSTIEVIETDCFANCKNLFLLTLPEGIKTLTGSICSSWTKLDFKPNSALYIYDQKLVIDKKNTTVMHYIGTNQNIEITILPSITTLRRNVFKGMSSIVSIKFAADSLLTRIDNECFSGCTNMRFINLPNKLEYIGSEAFYNCFNLVSFSSDMLTSLEDSCFFGCRDLLSINIEGSPITSLPSSCFALCSSITQITLPYLLVNISKDSFNGCTKLQSVIFPNTLENLGKNCFMSCALQAVDLFNCNKLNTIPDFAFSNNPSLTKVIFPDQLSSIELESFSFTKIKNFTTPRNLVSIGYNSFKSCRDLASFTIPHDSRLKNIGIGAFRNCISISSIECYSESFTVETGALFNDDRTSLILFPPAAPIKFFSLPSGTKTITEGAFMSCINLVSILIPTNGISRISNNAFEGCSNLRWINIPISVTFVGSDAFLGCTNLRCGLEIENRSKSFLISLVSNSKLDSVCLNDCLGLVTQNCYNVYCFGSGFIFLITPFIII